MRALKERSNEVQRRLELGFGNAEKLELAKKEFQEKKPAILGGDAFLL